MKKIICIGSATKDIFIPLDKVTVIDNPGNVTEKKFMAFEYGAKIYADAMFEFVGGSAVNVAAGLTGCGYKTFIFSRTDKSETGKWILKNISRLKIKRNYMQQSGNKTSETAVIILDRKTIEHIILRTGDSVENFNLTKAIKKFREKVDWVFVGSQKKGWQDNTNAVLEFAQQKKAKLAMNPSGHQIENYPKKLVSIFKHFEIIFFNRDEAIEIIKNNFGKTKDNIKFIIEKLAGFEAKNIVITDAENGAYVWSRKSGILHLGISADQKVDSTGAGDAFASGFLGSYIEQSDLKRALCCGIANSGSVISKIGATNGLLKLKELNMKMRELEGKIQLITK